MAFYDVIMESYGITESVRYESCLNEATVLLEGLFGTKYSKKDLNDPDKVKEILKKIQDTPQSEFTKRGVLSMALAFSSLVPTLIAGLGQVYPLFGLSALMLALSKKITKGSATEKIEIEKLKKNVQKTITALNKSKDKAKNDDEKKGIDNEISKLEKEIKAIDKASEKARIYFDGDGHGNPKEDTDKK